MHGFCLLTGNRRSMPGHLIDHLTAGRHVPGIFTIRHGARVGDVLETLLLLLYASLPEEYGDRILYIPLD